MFEGLNFKESIIASLEAILYILKALQLACLGTLLRTEFASAWLPYESKGLSSLTEDQQIVSSGSRSSLYPSEYFKLKVG